MCVTCTNECVVYLCKRCRSDSVGTCLAVFRVSLALVFSRVLVSLSLSLSVSTTTLVTLDAQQLPIKCDNFFSLSVLFHPVASFPCCSHSNRRSLSLCPDNRHSVLFLGCVSCSRVYLYCTQALFSPFETKRSSLPLLRNFCHSFEGVCKAPCSSAFSRFPGSWRGCANLHSATGPLLSHHIHATQCSHYSAQQGTWIKCKKHRLLSRPCGTSRTKTTITQSNRIGMKHIP